MTVIRLLARPMLASMFVVGGIDSLTHASGKVPKAGKVTDQVPTLAEKIAPGLPVPTDPATLVRINGGVQVVAGLALATGRMPRISALVLAASLAVSALVLAASANAQVVNLSKMTCKEFLSTGKDGITIAEDIYEK